MRGRQGTWVRIQTVMASLAIHPLFEQIPPALPRPDFEAPRENRRSWVRTTAPPPRKFAKMKQELEV